MKNKIKLWIVYPSKQRKSLYGFNFNLKNNKQ